MKFLDINIDIEARLVDQGGVKIELAPIDFSLLTELAGRQGRVLTRTFLEQALEMSPHKDISQSSYQCPTEPHAC